MKPKEFFCWQIPTILLLFYWGIVYLTTRHIPEITSIIITKNFVIELPFHVSRLWDVLFMCILMLVLQSTLCSIWRKETMQEKIQDGDSNRHPGYYLLLFVYLLPICLACLIFWILASNMWPSTLSFILTFIGVLISVIIALSECMKPISRRFVQYTCGQIIFLALLPMTIVNLVVNGVIILLMIVVLAILLFLSELATVSIIETIR